MALVGPQTVVPLGRTTSNCRVAGAGEVSTTRTCQRWPEVAPACEKQSISTCWLIAPVLPVGP